MMNTGAVYDALLSITATGKLTPEICCQLPDEIFRDADLMRAVALSAAVLGLCAVQVPAREVIIRAKPESSSIVRHSDEDVPKKGKSPFDDFGETVDIDEWGDEDEESLYLQEDAGDDTWTAEVLGSFSPVLAQYLREIRRFRVFTKDEELKKFEQLQNYHDELVVSPLITCVRTLGSMPENDEEGALQWVMIHEVSSLLHHVGRGIPEDLKEDRIRWASLYRDAELIHNEIVRHNLRFVVSVALKYRGRGMDVLDLIQEGNKGLMRAVDKFECARGLRFLTYATFWIRQAIRRALSEQRRIIRVPQHIDDGVKKYLEAVKMFCLQNGRNPSEQELAFCLGLTLPRVRAILQAVSLSTVSLDRPIRQGEEDTIVSLIPDPKSKDPVDILIAGDIPPWMERGLVSLTERERTIIILRGHTGEVPHSLEEVGAHFELSRERARQLEKQALEKLRRYYERYGDRDK